MKKKQQITTHYMPYQTYHPRHLKPEQQQQHQERLDNKNNNNNNKLICEQQQQTQFIRESQQNLQPTHNCYKQLHQQLHQEQQIEPVKSLISTTTAAVTNSFPTNTKMSSVIFGNNFYQTNLQPNIKTEPQQQQQYMDYQQNYNYMNNNYDNNNLNNNNNNYHNYNYMQETLSQNMNNNFYHLNTQQQVPPIVIKEEFVEEPPPSTNEQLERRKKLHLSFTTTLPQRQQQQPPNNQINTNNLETNIKTTTTTNVNVNDKITMDAREIANFLANELFMQQVSFEKFQYSQI